LTRGIKMIHPNPLEVEDKSPEGMHAGLLNMYCACKNLTSTKEGEIFLSCL
jgi:hypothetical protein